MREAILPASLVDCSNRLHFPIAIHRSPDVQLDIYSPVQNPVSCIIMSDARP